MSKRLTVLLAAVVAIAAIAAGCGSSDDGTETTAALTKAEFIKQGDAICEKGSKQIEDEAEEFAEDNDVDTSKPTEKQQEEVIATVVAPSLRTQAEDLDELGAPDGEEGKTEAIIDALEAGAEELEDDPGLLLKSDSNPLGKASELANQYGFKACGQQ